MFEKASRMKLRYQTGLGMISVEDLWDLPLTGVAVSLDGIAIDLNREVKESAEESFVVKKTGENEELNLAFDIVKHIITVRLAEAEEREKAEEMKAKKQRIMEIIHSKQDEALMEKSEDELVELLEALG